MHGTTESYLTAIDRIARDERRELLWLRAKEKGDTVDARRILGCDPTIPVRLRFFHDADCDALDVLDPRWRGEAYATLYDAHLDWLLGREESEQARLERRRVVRSRLGR